MDFFKKSIRDITYSKIYLKEIKSNTTTLNVLENIYINHGFKILLVNVSLIFERMERIFERMS